MNIRVDTRDAEQFLEGLYRDQVPFAASVALNQTAKDVQAGERAHLASTFILRRAEFLFRGVKIPRFSNKGDAELAVEVLIDERTEFLQKFEEGIPKVSTVGRALAIPVAARPSAGALVPQQLRPRALQLQAHRTATGKVQLKGKFGTFAIKGVGILQRIEGRVRLLYLFRKRARTPPLLRFKEIGQQIVQANWVPNFAAAWARAIRSAK